VQINQPQLWPGQGKERHGAQRLTGSSSWNPAPQPGFWTGGGGKITPQTYFHCEAVNKLFFTLPVSPPFSRSKYLKM